MPKRLLAAFLSVFSFAALSLGTVAAVAPTTWNFSVFEPANTITGRDLSLEYHILSTDPSDSFEVSLSQNGAFVASQTITNPYGDSSVFNVTVPAAGNYSFVVTAENQSGETASETRTVTFADPATGTTTTIYKNVGSSTATTTAAATAGASGGVVSDAAASTTKANGNALGATKSSSNSASNDDDKAWLWAIPSVAALGGAYYWFFYRQGKGPFAPVQ